MKTDIHSWSYLAQFFLEWNIFQINVVEQTKIHILCSVTLFRNFFHLQDNVEKYYRAEQVTHNNMAHAHCMLDT